MAFQRNINCSALALFIVFSVFTTTSRAAAGGDGEELKGYGQVCSGTYLDEDAFNQLYDLGNETGNNCAKGYSCGPAVLVGRGCAFCMPEINMTKWTEADNYTCSCPGAVLATGESCRDLKPLRYLEFFLEILPSIYSACLARFFLKALKRSLGEAREQNRRTRNGVWNPKILCLLFGCIALFAYTFLYPAKVAVSIIALPQDTASFLFDHTILFMLFYVLAAVGTTLGGLANVLVGLTWLETYVQVRKMRSSGGSSFKYLKGFVVVYCTLAVIINMGLVLSKRPSWVEFFGIINCLLILPSYIWGSYKLGSLLQELAAKVRTQTSAEAMPSQRSTLIASSTAESTASQNSSPPLEPVSRKKSLLPGGRKLSKQLSTMKRARRKKAKRYDKVAIQARSVRKAARRVCILAALFIFFAAWSALVVLQCLAGGGDRYCAAYAFTRFTAKTCAMMGLHVIYRYFERGRYLRKPGGKSELESQDVSSTTNTRPFQIEEEEDDGDVVVSEIEMPVSAPATMNLPASAAPDKSDAHMESVTITITEERERKLSTNSHDLMKGMAIKPGRKRSSQS